MLKHLPLARGPRSKRARQTGEPGRVYIKCEWGNFANADTAQEKYNSRAGEPFFHLPNNIKPARKFFYFFAHGAAFRAGNPWYIIRIIIITCSSPCTQRNGLCIRWTRMYELVHRWVEYCASKRICSWRLSLAAPSFIMPNIIELWRFCMADSVFAVWMPNQQPRTVYRAATGVLFELFCILPCERPSSRAQFPLATCYASYSRPSAQRVFLCERNNFLHNSHRRRPRVSALFTLYERCARSRQFKGFAWKPFKQFLLLMRWIQNPICWLK